MSVGLNSNFAKNVSGKVGGHSVSISAHKNNAIVSSITDVNPLASLDLDCKEPPRTVDRPKGIDKDGLRGVN